MATSSASSRMVRPSRSPSARMTARSAPWRIIASVGAPRNDCNVASQAMASRTFVFPCPLSPSSAVSPGARSSSVSAYDRNPSATPDRVARAHSLRRWRRSRPRARRATAWAVGAPTPTHGRPRRGWGRGPSPQPPGALKPWLGARGGPLDPRLPHPGFGALTVRLRRLLPPTPSANGLRGSHHRNPTPGAPNLTTGRPSAGVDPPTAARLPRCAPEVARRPRRPGRA